MASAQGDVPWLRRSTLWTVCVEASSRATLRQLLLDPNSPCRISSGGPLPTVSTARFNAMSSASLLLLLRRQVGAVPFEHFRRHADRLAQRRMRVDRLADVGRLAAHLDRE